MASMNAILPDGASELYRIRDDRIARGYDDQCAPAPPRRTVGDHTMNLQSLLGVELPIIQAPMAGVQGSALAVAVSNAGGLGSLPCAMLGPDAMRKELSAIHAQTSGPINVNFFCHTPPAPRAEREAAWRAALAPYYKELGLDPAAVAGGIGRAPFSPDAADVLEEFQPAVVSFHFGLPSPELLARVRGWGAKILSSATTVEEARWLEARGIDAVIAQGLEAGGHRGMFLSEDLTTQVGTLALVPQIVGALKVPVIAAGGIADARGVHAALALGAAGVQVGTAYLLCPEATTSAVHRAALKIEAARHTTLTNVFSGRPARGIVNRLIREIGPVSAVAPAFPLAAAAVAPLRAKAESLGSGDFSPLWSGQNATGCKEVTAAEITRELAGGL
jgi:nitronate monooxygenase